MNFLRDLFFKIQKKEVSDDLMGITKIIGPLMDKAVNETFSFYCAELIIKPITFIIPAVWGAAKDGELTSSQKEMHKKIVPVMDKILSFFECDQLTDAQRFAIGYVVRGLFISKITYMIEATKKQRLIQNQQLEQERNNILGQIETIGNA